MIPGNVELPFVGENHPTTIYETGYTCIDKLITQIFGSEHVVPTTFSRPNIAL